MVCIKALPAACVCLVDKPEAVKVRRRYRRRWSYRQL